MIILLGPRGVAQHSMCNANLVLKISCMLALIAKK